MTDERRVPREPTQEMIDAAWPERSKSFADQWRAMYDAAPAAPAWTDAQRDVIAERDRQKSAEGWTPQHDDEHDGAELAQAAGCYALHAAGRYQGVRPAVWPWEPQWWKPTTPRRDLVKAGALILAEIERLDRAGLAAAAPAAEADQRTDWCECGNANAPALMHGTDRCWPLNQPAPAGRVADQSAACDHVWQARGNDAVKCVYCKEIRRAVPSNTREKGSQYGQGVPTGEPQGNPCEVAQVRRPDPNESGTLTGGRNGPPVAAADPDVAALVARLTDMALSMDSGYAGDAELVQEAAAELQAMARERADADERGCDHMMRADKAEAERDKLRELLRDARTIMPPNYSGAAEALLRAIDAALKGAK